MKFWPRLLILFTLLLLLWAPAHAQGASEPREQTTKLFDDPRVIGWSKDFLAGKREEVLRAVELDLKSPAPHPFSPHIWTVIQYDSGRLSEVWSAMSDARLRVALGIQPEILPLYSDGQYKKLLALYPSSRAGEINDLWSLFFLSWSALNEKRPEEALAYNLRAMRLRPDFFGFAWTASRDLLSSEKTRPRVEALIRPGGEFAGTMVGKYLVKELGHLPTDEFENDEDSAWVDEWLKERPRDERALYRKGLLLARFGHDEQAIQAMADAMAAYPFRAYVSDKAKALVRLNRIDEAREYVGQVMGLHSRDAAEAASKSENWWASILIDTGRMDQAHDSLDAALKRWPDDARLLDRRAAWGIKSEHLSEALADARRATQLKPDQLAYQERLLEALQKANNLEEGYNLFLQLEKQFSQKDETLYSRANDILTLLGTDARDKRLGVCERAVAEYPGSPWMHNLLAVSLNGMNRSDEALAQLRASFDLHFPARWYLNRFSEWTRKKSGPQQAIAEINQLVKRFPWIDELSKYGPAKPAAIAENAPSSQPPTNEPRLVTQLGHSGTITSVAFSPDGRFVVTGSGDTTARLWETASGKEVRRFERHIGSVDTVAYSGDGRHLVTGGADKMIIVWDVLTGKEVQRIEGPARILSLAISPDGKSVLAGGASANVYLWNIATKEEAKRFKGHQGSVNAVAFSSDGRFVLTGSSDKTARLWDAATGSEIQVYENHLDAINSVALSRDNRQVLTGSADKTVRLWDAGTGVEFQSFTSATEVRSVAFSPDGHSIAMGSRRGNARVLDSVTGKELQHFDGHMEDVNAVVFAPDGSRVLTGSLDKTARLWNVATGKEEQRFEGRSGNVAAIAFSPSGRFILTGGNDNSARLWDATTGKEIQSFVGHQDRINAVAFSSDNRFVATGSGDRTARIWDTTTGKQTQLFKDHSADVMSVAFSPDSRYLLTGTKDGVMHLWDVATATKSQHFDGNYDWVNTAAFSPDSKYLLTVGIDRTARLWETATGAEKQSFKGHTGDVWSVAFSPDGKLVATGSLDKTARLWDVTSGAEVHRLEHHNGTVISVAFSPDGKYLLSGSANTPAQLWEVASGNPVRVLEGASRDVDFIRFSPDGHFVVTGGPDKFVRLWDAGTGKEIQSFEEHPDAALAVAFSPDSHFVLTGSRDGTTRVADTSNGHLLCRLISFRGNAGNAAGLDGRGGWAVVDQDGRFDASNAGDVEGLHWLVGQEPIALSQLKERYYEPGLLAKIMHFSKDPLRDVSALRDVKLFPDVDWKPPAPGSKLLTINLTNRGGGIGRVQVLVNDKEVVADARGKNFDPQAKQASLTVDLAGSSFIPGRENKISVVAFNADGYLDSGRTSRGASLVWAPAGSIESAPPELYAIVAGISNYAAPELALSFAAKDAVDMAHALELGAKQLFGVDKVHISLLTTASDPHAISPTKANFEQAFREARKAKPDDILIVYLAGHGITLKQASDTYAYLTRDANSTDSSKLSADPALTAQMAVTNEELAEWTKQVPAVHQVMILDTCAAGAAAVKLVEKREVTSDQIRAIERLKDRTGFHVLMGSAADAPSYEASQYGQGLLTYALLQGMSGAALRDDEYVDVQRLFQYAADQVPQMARNIGGIQQPIVAAPKGTSFDVGRILREARASIPLAKVKPIILRPLLINPDEGTDNLNLNQTLRKRLREENYVTSRGDRAAQIFIDEEDFPGAIRPSGTYLVEGQQVRIRLILSRDGQKIATLQVEGIKDDPVKTVSNIMDAMSGAIRNLPPVK